MNKAQTDLGLEPPADPMGERTAQRLRVLDRLVEIGMEIAEAARTEAVEAPQPGVDYCQRYATAARAVRLTVLLEDKLSRPSEEQLRQVSAADRSRARMRVTMAMGAAALDGVESGEDGEDTEANRRFAEMAERLERPELAELIEAYPPPVAVARLCRMFGLPAEWERWLELGDAAMAELSIRLSDEAEPPMDPPEPRPARGYEPEPLDTG